MSEEIDKYINEDVKTELKQAVKKLLIESVDIKVIYKVFSRLTREEIDEIEAEASVIRQRNFNREYWKQYREEHKDDPDNFAVKIFNEAKEEAKRDYAAMVIKNMKADNVPVETIQKIFPKYSIKEMEELVIEYENKEKQNFIIKMMTDYSQKHPDEDNVISKFLTDLDEKYWRDAQILLIKDMKGRTPIFALAEYFSDFTEDEIEKM